ncbi:MAG: 16S rRNA (uracil(1498)-N(3))-methyltransferase [Candidatus Omnitrophota bacterium]
MNLILLFKNELIGSAGHVRLTGRRHAHIRTILKSSIGDELCVGVEGGRIGRGRIAGLDDAAVEMDVSLSADPPLPLELTLVLALPRPRVFNRALFHVTTLGVKKIIVFRTWKVTKSYWESPLLRKERMREQCILGLEQAKDTVIPEIVFRTDFRPFVEDELPGIIGGARAYVADTEADTAPQPDGDGPVVLVIGPDGGFVPFEIEKLKGAGCMPVQLGERIMRVETAVIAGITRFGNIGAGRKK